jgi:hypothetical protein
LLSTYEELFCKAKSRKLFGQEIMYQTYPHVMDLEIPPAQSQADHLIINRIIQRNNFTM